MTNSKIDDSLDLQRSSETPGAPKLIEVLPQHHLDEARLLPWLQKHVPDFGELRALRQFQGGQSNPTYLIEGNNRSCVLRKRPPGVLLPSAHAVGREFQVIQALANTRVPVPQAFALCEDPGVIGTSFYAMEFVPGRILTDLKLQQTAAAERTSIYLELAQTLAALHDIEWREGMLSDFGKPQNYLARQVRRWSKQFAASGIDSEDMTKLTAWVEAHIPLSDIEGEGCTLVHGDYRLGNTIYDYASSRLLAVLDWELATIGNPLADLSYNCLAWRIPVELNGLQGHDDPTIPKEEDYLAAYCVAAGRRNLPQFEFYMAFSLFRLVAILAGVYRRAKDGNTADASGLDAGRRLKFIARIGCDTAFRA